MSTMSRIGVKALGRPRLLALGARRPDVGFVLSAFVLVALVVWALSNPPVPLPVPPPGGVWAISLAAFAVAVLSHHFRLRVGVATAPRLPKPRYAMYIAAIVIAGTPAAVLIAAICPFLVYALDLAQGRARLATIVREGATDAAITLVSGLLYVTITGPQYPFDALLRSSDMWRHVIASLVASVIMFLGVICADALSREGSTASVFGRLGEGLRDPLLRFQLLLLSVGPLVPFAEFMDDRVSVFAWTCFLAPLTAYYYLALLSVRLQQSTAEVLATSAKLGASRMREAELSGYAALVTRVQEDERRRLSRELHDDTAQSLIVLSRGLETFTSREEGRPITSRDKQLLGDLVDLSKRTLEGVRRACQNLRPSVLDDLGLSAALESLAQLVTRRGLPCAFNQIGEYEPWPPEIEVTLYRIAQEALTNTQRHAHATRATLTIAYHLTRVEVRIGDNGIGFDYGAVARLQRERDDDQRDLSGLGLVGMRERASQIGGTLDVSSTPGHGTTITISVPLASLDATIAAPAETRAETPTGASS